MESSLIKEAVDKDKMNNLSMTTANQSKTKKNLKNKNKTVN
jgi:hypothetical protein